MSINTTDKSADNVETLVDNTNEAIVIVNNQLDASVLANLTTKNVDTLVNAINELNSDKLDKNASQISNDLSIVGKLTADSITVKTDDDGNSTALFYDTTSSKFIKLFWNNSVRKWQLSFPNDSIVDIADSIDINDLQTQIDNISSVIDYNFNTNGQTLILKQLPADQIINYTGPAGELVINSDDWTEIHIQDGETKGGVIVSGSLVVDWAPNTLIRKNQCVIYDSGLYRSRVKHTTSDTFDIDLYDIVASYKKFIETQTLGYDTDTITLSQAIQIKDNVIINVGGLIVQNAKYTIVDPYHIRFDEQLPSGTSIEITYQKTSNLINSSIVIDSYAAKSDNEYVIHLSGEVENPVLINQVNVENVVLLTSEWKLDEGNRSITLKTPLNMGDRAQVIYWKGVNIAQNGITFKPTLINNVLSWTNDGGLDNPDPIELVNRNEYTELVGIVNTKANDSEVVHRDGMYTMEGNLKMGTFQIKELANGTISTDAINKSQLDNAKSELTEAMNTLLSNVYPVGSIYISTQATCPLATLIAGSQWQLVAQDRALWGGNGSNANTTIEAGLPNITGTFSTEDAGHTPSGAFAIQQTRVRGRDGNDNYADIINFNASRSSSIYGASTTVQPPAYRVNVWRRTV